MVMNKSINYDISKIRTEKNKEFFIEMIPYISEKIISYQLNANENKVEIFITHDADEAVLENLEMLFELSNVDEVEDSGESRIVLDKRSLRPFNTAQIFEALLKRRDIYELAAGYFSYSGLFLQVMNYFHTKIKEFAFQNFEPQEIDFPTSMPIERFRQGGYFQTFPHHIIFKTCMNNNLKVLSDFADLQDNYHIQNMKNPSMIIKNAACAPIYMFKEGQNLDHLEVFFVKDKCQRNESANVSELSRLNEFNMVEIVFIGEEQEVEKNINKSQELWEFWIDKFKLNCFVETAHDSFFASNYKKLKFFQLMGNSKLEFKVLLPHRDQYIAAASINFHRNHFSKKYDIKYKDGQCYSACIAFGLERMAYAFLAQMGLKIKEWPAEVWQEVNSYIPLGGG